MYYSLSLSLSRVNPKENNRYFNTPVSVSLSLSLSLSLHVYWYNHIFTQIYNIGRQYMWQTLVCIVANDKICKLQKIVMTIFFIILFSFLESEMLKLTDVCYCVSLVFFGLLLKSCRYHICEREDVKRLKWPSSMIFKIRIQ